MSKKAIIISIASIILIGTIVVVALRVFGVATDSTPESVRQPGDSVAIADTPDLKACEISTEAEIKSALGDDAESLSQGQRQGIVAHNLQTAESCAYTFTANGSVGSQLFIESYPYIQGDATETTNLFDATWKQIVNLEFPDYTLGYPAYYKKETANSRTSFAIQIVNGPRHYRFEINQPSGQETYDDGAAIDVLLSLVLSADYTVSNHEDIPPAPITTPDPVDPGDISTPEPPTLTPPDDAPAPGNGAGETN